MGNSKTNTKNAIKIGTKLKVDKTLSILSKSKNIISTPKIAKLIKPLINFDKMVEET